KPMIFYAYDLDEFSDQGRGFYEDYINYVPGPVARTSKEVIDIIKEERYSIDRIEAFNAENFPFLDGKAASRIIDLITNSK
ncbi:MAG: CDP-glycerol glycerophosphotransferase family protein, partial [Bacillota bacterium]|nr:CDP-glycerol glycerophosphotransferase family protein [Bacillota bacterium]